MRVSEMLTAIAAWLESPENEALMLAEHDDECLTVAAQACVEAAFILRAGAEEVETIEPVIESVITAEALDELAELATSFDESDDERLKRTASVLDEILLTIAAPQSSLSELKKAQDRKIDTLRNNYEYPKEELDEKHRVAETVKAIEASPYTKDYRIMEAPLSSRTCPDHPGAQMGRVGDGVWQCEMDKKTYNFQAGYTDHKGNKVPGSDIANQFEKSKDNHTAFETRDQRLNNR